MPTPPQQMTVWLCERYHVPTTYLHQVDRCSNTITQPITVHDSNDISKCNLRIPRPLYERCPDHRTPYNSQPEYDSMLRASMLVTLQQLGFTTAVTSEIGTPLQQGQTAESQLCLPQESPTLLMSVMDYCIAKVNNAYIHLASRYMYVGTPLTVCNS